MHRNFRPDGINTGASSGRVERELAAVWSIILFSRGRDIAEREYRQFSFQRYSSLRLAAKVREASCVGGTIMLPSLRRANQRTWIGVS